MWWRSVARAQSARRFLSYVIVAASVFAAAPGRAQTPAPVAAQIAPADLVKKAAELKAAIEALKPGEVIKVDPHEMAALATAISRAADSKVVATEWAKALTALLTDRTPARQIDFSNEEARKALRKLREAIVKFIQKSPAAPAQSVNDINAQAALLASGLEKLKPAEGDANKDLAGPQLVQLAATMIAKVLEPTFAATVWANDLAVVLEDRRPRGDAAMETALDKLTEVVPDLPVLRGPFLNIVQAWFGDLYYVRRAMSGQLRINPDTGTGARVCDATNEVRTYCQGKRTCPFAPDASAPTVLKPDKVKLCGEHPVPFASADVIGLVIEYQCLKATQSRWDDLQSNWRIDLEDEKYKPRVVMLRAATDVTIRCEAQLDP